MTHAPHTNVDIAIITIRDDEFRALLHAFPHEVGLGYHRGGHREYTLRSADCGNGHYRIAILRLIEQGNGEAQNAARDLLEDLQPNAALVVGVAAAVPSEEVCLGDVVVATQIHDFSAEKNQFLAPPTYAATGGTITIRLASKVANLAGRQRDLGDWTTNLPTPPIVSLENLSLYGDPAWKDKVTRSLTMHYRHGRLTYRVPKHVDGAIASSDRLIQDPAIVRPWLTSSRKLLAVEMESGGAFRALRERCPMLTIRGIDSIIGMNRDEEWTKYACASAAAFTRAFLRTFPIPRKGTTLDSQPAQASKQTATMPRYESMETLRPFPDPYVRSTPPSHSQPPPIDNLSPARLPTTAYQWHEVSIHPRIVAAAPNGAGDVPPQSRPAVTWGGLLIVAAVGLIAAMGLTVVLGLAKELYGDATIMDSTTVKDPQPAHRDTLPTPEGTSAQVENRKARTASDHKHRPETAVAVEDQGGDAQAKESQPSTEVAVADQGGDAQAKTPGPPPPRIRSSKTGQRPAKSAAGPPAVLTKAKDKVTRANPPPTSATPLDPYPSTEQTPATKCTRKPKKVTREMGFNLDMPVPFGIRPYLEDAMEAARDRAISRAQSRCQEYKMDDETVTVVIDTESYKCPSGEFGNCGFKGTGRCRFFAATEECN